MNKSFRKVLSVLMSVLMIAAVIPIINLPTAKADTWNGTYNSPSGFTWDGSSYNISSAQGLAYFLYTIGTGTDYSGRTINLNTDVNLNSIDFGANVWNNYDNYFRGTFNGNNHTISNFRMTTDNHRIAMFRSIDGATIKNVNYTNVYINYSNNKNGYGVVGGYIKGVCTFENIHVNSGSVTGYNYVGGLVGEMQSTDKVTFRNCSNAATIKANGANAAGIGARFDSDQYLYFYSCSNTGTVTSSGDRAGGMCAHVKGRVNAENCSNTGTITAGSSDAGGMTGWIEDDESSFTGCTNTGNITAGAVAGGIMGYFGSDKNDKPMILKNNTNRGTIRSNGGYNAGGIAGHLDTDATHTFENNTNYGSVTSASLNAGGIVGYNKGGGNWTYNYNYGNIYGYGDNGGGILGGTQDDTNNFNYCYNSAYVEGKNSVGGIIGYGGNNQPSYFTNCGNSGDIRSTNDAAGGIMGYLNGGSATSFTQCWNVGNISAKNDAGGIEGKNYNHTIITRCFNTGDITTYNNQGGGSHGGIIGYTGNYNSSSASSPCMTDCYNWGNVSGANYNGGLVGMVRDSSTYYITYSYNAGNVTNGNNVAAICPNGANVSTAVYYNNSKSVGTAQGTGINDTSMRNRSMTTSGNIVTNTWGVKIGSTTYYYPVLTWYRNLFKFTYNFVDAESNTNQTFADKTYNSSFTTPNPTRTGYTSGSWYNTSDTSKTIGKGVVAYSGATSPFNTIPVTQSKSNVQDITGATTTYDLNWAANRHTVTLDNQSATTAGTTSVQATYDSAMPGITVPTRTGYTFGGYYTSTNGSGTKYYNADGTSAKIWNIDAARTLYAQWTAIKYTVTLDNQSATTAGAASVTATYDAAMPSAAMPSRTGYTFGGYYTETNGAGTKYYNADGSSAKAWNITGNTTLYAMWTANSYAVVLDNQSATTTGTTGINPVYDSAMPSITVPTRTGYTFGGYYDAANGAGTKYYKADGTSARTWNKDGTATLYAYWIVNQYTVTYYDWDMTTVIKTESVDYGSMPTPPAIPVKAPDATFHYNGEWNVDDFTPVVKEAETGEPESYYVVYNMVKHSGGTATCAEKAKCTVCGYEYGGYSLHSYGLLIAEKAPSCSNTGTIAHYECSVCHKTFDKNKVETTDLTIGKDPTKHGMSIIKIAEKESTCAEQGNNAYYMCGDCGACFKDLSCTVPTTADAELKALDTVNGHTYGAFVKDASADTHTKTCTVCDEATANHTVTENCFGGNSDCMTLSVCDVCGEEYGTTGSHTLTHHEAVTPSCVASGHVEYWSCSVCSKNFADADAATELTTLIGAHSAGAPEKTNVVPSTCKTLGTYTEVVKCSACGNVLSTTDKDETEYGAHSFGEMTAEVAATCMAPGTKAYKDCSVCNKHFDAEGNELTDLTIAENASNHTGNNTYEVGKTKATCTTEGYTGDTVCECGVVVVPGTVTGTVAHNYTEYVAVAVPATCVANRKDTYKCSMCDATTVKEIADSKDAAAHTGNNTYEVGKTTATCTAEGYTGDTVCECGVTVVYGTAVEKAPHTFTKYLSVAQSATCVSNRMDKYKCSKCDATTVKEVENTINPTRHTGNNTYEVGKTKATCTTEGYTGDTVCECGVVVVPGTVTGTTAHNYTEYVAVAVPATCVANRKDTYKCSMCDATTEKEIADSKDAAAHTGNNTNEVGKTAPTCEEEGYTGDTVCECGAVITPGTTIEVIDHNYNVPAGVKSEATCMANRFDIYKCATCALTIDVEAEDTKDASNHTGYNTYEVGKKAASCTEKGYTGDTVCECGVTVEYGSEIGMNAHSYSVFVGVDTPATCVANRKDTYKCANCDAVTVKEKANSKDASAHTGNNTEEVDKKEATCLAKGYTGDTVCECGVVITAGTETELADHTYGEWISQVEAGCTTTGVKGHYTCSVCSKNFDADKNVMTSLVIAAGHKTTAVAEVSADCGNAGVKAHYICSVCDKKFADAAGKTAVTDAQLVITATGAHNNALKSETAPTCVAKGEKVYECTLCGATKTTEIAATGIHNYVLVSEKAPTENTEGEKVFECTVCGDKVVETIPSLHEQSLCEYCGTDHHSLLSRIVCFVIQLVYKIVNHFKVIGFK